ncbi:uncharacterized protein [Arachis hypogaea]|uniref:uncharacterized protein n=1 Tax=Arachis hypogaea TaxID=3818 RepID=UPI001105700E|nr:uncharacterized protein LOC114925357 [Arachis hypogaea]
MALKGRGGQIIRNTRIDQSQLSSCRPGANSSDASALDAEDNELHNVGQSTVHTKTRSNRKLVIVIEKGINPKRFADHTVTRDITKDLLSRMPSPALRWQDYCPNMKDELFKGFLTIARTIWNKTMHDRYHDILKRARDRAFKEANSTSITDIKGHRPKAMKVDVWNGLVDHWLDSKWQNKSVASQKNRATPPAHKLHTAGSISFGEHKRRKDLYGETISQKYGEDLIDQLKVDPDMWTEIAGTNKKGQVHGLGYSLDIGIRDHRDVPLPKDTGVSIVKSVSQADITEAIKEALPSAINAAVLPSAVNEAIQSNLLSLLSKIPGFSQENNANLGRVNEKDH